MRLLVVLMLAALSVTLAGCGSGGDGGGGGGYAVPDGPAADGSLVGPVHGAQGPADLVLRSP